VGPRTTVGLYFEVTNPHTSPIPQGQRPHVQLVTTYQHSSGAYRMRVTTAVLQWQHDASNAMAVRAGFDQECAVALMSRIAAYRTRSEPTTDILRWLDRSLIRLCAKFAEYRKDEPESFQLGVEFSLYPQFMFHLRRSQFLQTFNCSPDETAFYRNKLIGETVANTLVMVQPALLNYTFQAPPHPVLLDLDSVKHDNILMLDTFFHVVIHHGATMAAWRDQGYHLRPDHANFKAMLQAPIDDAQMIMRDRFPVPRFIVCDQHKSQARFLLAKLNPSKPQYSGDGSEQQLFTDDVSLRVFMEHLVKLAVASN
jgi:protein transport protein SEC23